jgi:hypothetical protein
MKVAFNKKLWFAIFALCFSFSSQIAFADEPPVKKSKSGICHAKGSTYYSKTKNFTAYQTMEACLESGGRRPKR